MSKRTFYYLPQTQDAIALVGLEIARARREQRWTAQNLADRVGISLTTLRKIERGDPTVGIGIFFETAVILGIALFGVESDELRGFVDQRRDQLAVLPAHVRGSEAVDDNF